MGIHWTPATRAEIGEQIDRLISAMPPPRGNDADMLARSYFEGLAAFPAAAIREAVAGFFSGRFGEQKWLPTAPQLATYVRQCLPDRRPEGPVRWYTYDRPNSPCLQENIEKERARELVRQGFFPKGSIWVPGDEDGARHMGHLHGPDPEWKGPRRFHPYNPKDPASHSRAPEGPVTAQERAMVHRFREAVGLLPKPKAIGPSPAARIAAETAARRSAREGDAA